MNNHKQTLLALEKELNINDDHFYFRGNTDNSTSIYLKVFLPMKDSNNAEGHYIAMRIFEVIHHVISGKGMLLVSLKKSIKKGYAEYTGGGDGARKGKYYIDTNRLIEIHSMPLDEEYKSKIRDVEPPPKKKVGRKKHSV